MHGNFPSDRVKFRVVASPVGPGEVTNLTYAGYPEVNGVAVAWLEQEDGWIFDPDGVRDGNLMSLTPGQASARSVWKEKLQDLLEASRGDRQMERLVASVGAAEIERGVHGEEWFGHYVDGVLEQFHREKRAPR